MTIFVILAYLRLVEFIHKCLNLKYKSNTLVFKKQIYTYYQKSPYSFYYKDFLFGLNLDYKKREEN